MTLWKHAARDRCVQAVHSFGLEDEWRGHHGCHAVGEVLRRQRVDRGRDSASAPDRLFWPRVYADGVANCSPARDRAEWQTLLSGQLPIGITTMATGRCRSFCIDPTARVAYHWQLRIGGEAPGFVIIDG